jgi:hypothetical protein
VTLFLFVLVVILLAAVTLGFLWWIWRPPVPTPAREPAVPAQYMGIPIITDPSIDDDRIYLIGAEGKPVGVITGLKASECLPPFAGEHPDHWPQHPPMSYDWRRDGGFSCRKSS